MKKTIFTSLLAMAAMLAVACGNRPATSLPEEEPADEDTVAAAHPEYLPTIEIGSDAPELVAADTLGNEVRLSDYRGKYVIVDFWASWCPDCRKETPELKVLHAELKGRQIQGAEVEVLGYSFDRTADAWKSYIRKEALEWPQMSTLEAKWHDIAASQDYGVNWIPAFVVVSPDGKVAAKAISVKGVRAAIARF